MPVKIFKVVKGLKVKIEGLWVKGLKVKGLKVKGLRVKGLKVKIKGLKVKIKGLKVKVKSRGSALASENILADTPSEGRREYPRRPPPRLRHRMRSGVGAGLVTGRFAMAAGAGRSPRLRSRRLAGCPLRSGQRRALRPSRGTGWLAGGMGRAGTLCWWCLGW